MYIKLIIIILLFILLNQQQNLFSLKITCSSPYYAVIFRSPPPAIPLGADSSRPT